MRCHMCGSTMEFLITNLPFKVSNTTIVIFKELPVRQCRRCSEYLLDDNVLEEVDSLLQRINVAAELEVLKYAA
ncbi:MAG: YgiT-type zinc finger protein [bacterium]|nr:YgiT-type zinc finger protein [bacterium]